MNVAVEKYDKQNQIKYKQLTIHVENNHRNETTLFEKVKSKLIEFERESVDQVV